MKINFDYESSIQKINSYKVNIQREHGQQLNPFNMRPEKTPLNSQERSPFFLESDSLQRNQINNVGQENMKFDTVLPNNNLTPNEKKEDDFESKNFSFCEMKENENSEISEEIQPKKITNKLDLNTSFGSFNDKNGLQVEKNEFHFSPYTNEKSKFIRYRDIWDR